jgi:hypothetical protein
MKHMAAVADLAPLPQYNHRNIDNCVTCAGVVNSDQLHKVRIHSNHWGRHVVMTAWI